MTSCATFAMNGAKARSKNFGTSFPVACADPAVVRRAMDEVPTLAHRLGGELREIEHGAAKSCDCKDQEHGINL